MNNCYFELEDIINVIPCSGEEKGMYHHLYMPQEQIPGKIIESLNNLEFRLNKMKECFNNPKKGINKACSHNGSIQRYNWNSSKMQSYNYNSCNPPFKSNVKEKCKNFWYIFLKIILNINTRNTEKFSPFLYQTNIENKNVFILTSHNHRLQKVILPLISHTPSYGFATGFCLKIDITSNSTTNLDIIYDGMPDKTEQKYNYITKKNNLNNNINYTSVNINELIIEIIKESKFNIPNNGVTIYLIRHGNSLHNGLIAKKKNKATHNLIDSTLSPIGMLQAKQVGIAICDDLQTYNDKNIKIFGCSSYLNRSQLTTLIILNILNNSNNFNNNEKLKSLYIYSLKMSFLRYIKVYLIDFKKDQQIKEYFDQLDKNQFEKYCLDFITKPIIDIQNNSSYNINPTYNKESDNYKVMNFKLYIIKTLEHFISKLKKKGIHNNIINKYHNLINHKGIQNDPILPNNPILEDWGNSRYIVNNNKGIPNIPKIAN